MPRLTRREMLYQCANGFGAVALSALWGIYGLIYFISSSKKKSQAMLLKTEVA